MAHGRHLLARCKHWLEDVTGRSGELSQLLISPDFDLMKYTQLSPLKYKNSKIIKYTKNVQTSLYKNDVSS